MTMQDQEPQQQEPQQHWVDAMLSGPKPQNDDQVPLRPESQRPENHSAAKPRLTDNEYLHRIHYWVRFMGVALLIGLIGSALFGVLQVAERVAFSNCVEEKTNQLYPSYTETEARLYCLHNA